MFEVLNPFHLFGRMLLASFKITGYVVSYSAQAVWHLASGNRSHVGDAIGNLGHAMTDAISEIFRPPHSR